MQLQIGAWRFCPGLWPTVAVLIVLPALIGLGLWQLDRADQKRSLRISYEQSVQQPPASLHENMELLSGEEKHYWRRVLANGQFDNSLHVLLDNQVVNGKAGYYVFTPFKLEQTNRVFLVNRGWIAAGLDRSLIPDLSAATATVRIKAEITGKPPTGVMFKPAQAEKLGDGIYRVNDIQIDEVQSLYTEKLSRALTRLSPDSEQALVAQWSKPGFGEAKHTGYAFQWFAMATVLTLIFIILNLKKQDT